MTVLALENDIKYTVDTMQNIRRGDVLLCDLSGAAGSEQAGIKYVLCISNNIGNANSPCIEVACITSQMKNRIPTHVSIPLGNGLPKPSVILCEQKRTIDKGRIISKKTSLSPELLSQVNQALKISLALD